VLRACKFTSEETCERKNAILCAFDKEGPQVSAYNTRMDIIPRKISEFTKSAQKKIDVINRRVFIKLMTCIKKRAEYTRRMALLRRNNELLEYPLYGLVYKDWLCNLLQLLTLWRRNFFLNFSTPCI
jgi:hypothetical protein